MKLEPLHVARFRYQEEWGVDLGGEARFFFIAEGTVAGRINGRLRGANHPRRRSEGTFEPDFQGVIESDDGAEILFDWRGYGRSYPKGRRQIVLAATHVSDDERYRWLNDVVCAATGEVRAAGDDVELVLEVAELVWEAPADG
jgi:Protein of unknown function (DUF3237)